MNMVTNQFQIFEIKISLVIFFDVRSVFGSIGCSVLNKNDTFEGYSLKRIYNFSITWRNLLVSSS